MISARGARAGAPRPDPGQRREGRPHRREMRSPRRSQDGRVAVAALDVRATEPPPATRPARRARRTSSRRRTSPPRRGKPPRTSIGSPPSTSWACSRTPAASRRPPDGLATRRRSWSPAPRRGTISFELIEELLREEVRQVLAAGFQHLYVFGTGGEGYAVDTRRFRQVVDLFYEETRAPDVNPMVGVIGLSTVADRRADRVRPRRRVPDVPDLAAVVGPGQRRGAAPVLRRHVRPVPGLAIPQLQPAADQAGPDRPGLRPDHRRGPEPRRHQDDGRWDRRRRGADRARG